MLTKERMELNKELFHQDCNMFNKKMFGIEKYKINYFFKQFLYNTFKIKMPKMKDQYKYWLIRGKNYLDDFVNSGYMELELFFQDLLMDRLKMINFNSIFEAGCGFGWNLKRVYFAFPNKEVGGLDFSLFQLLKARDDYLKGLDILTICGDIVQMPFRDNLFDIGFSLGVFMNIHYTKIEHAIEEMLRVSKKYIIHIEYDEDHTLPELKRRRAFKTNIISHNYRAIYEKKKCKIRCFETYKDFFPRYNTFIKSKNIKVKRWEQWEGISKYIIIVIEKKDNYF
jgi:ubiquinone/menaquinone biosynthesis C-methylase UbiE